MMKKICFLGASYTIAPVAHALRMYNRHEIVNNDIIKQAQKERQNVRKWLEEEWGTPIKSKQLKDYLTDEFDLEEMPEEDVTFLKEWVAELELMESGRIGVFEEADSEAKCTHCQKDFEVKDTVAKTPCGHMMHKDCLCQRFRDGSDYCSGHCQNALKWEDYDPAVLAFHHTVEGEYEENLGEDENLSESEYEENLLYFLEKKLANEQKEKEGKWLKDWIGNLRDGEMEISFAEESCSDTSDINKYVRTWMHGTAKEKNSIKIKGNSMQLAERSTKI